jgi:hypothetical protein
MLDRRHGDTMRRHAIGTVRWQQKLPMAPERSIFPAPSNGSPPDPDKTTTAKLFRAR